MSKTIFRGTTLDGTAEREIALWESGWGIVLSVADALDEGPPNIMSVRLDLDMADSLFASGADRVTDVRAELEAQE